MVGKKRWMLALIDGHEEDLSAQLRQWVHDNTGQRNRANATISDVTEFINNVLLKPWIDEEAEGVHPITDDTARRWVKRLGFRYKKGTRTVYCDKHEFLENKKARDEFIAKLDNRCEQ